MTDAGAFGSRSDATAAGASSTHPLDERYYVRGETEAYGPYDGRTIKDMIEQGRLVAETGIARVGATEWTDIKSHPLFGSFLRGGPVAAIAKPVRLPGAPGVYAEPVEGVRYAGFWIRLAAYLLDGIFLGFILSIVAGVIAGIFFLVAASQNTAAIMIVLFVATLIIIAIGVLYHVLCLRSSWQATPGKRLIGLYVTTESGQPLSTGRATGRYFAYILSALPFYVGFMMIGWNAEKKGLHDMVCETRVLHGKL